MRRCRVLKGRVEGESAVANVYDIVALGLYSRAWYIGISFEI
jgi:hypothetical protein